MSLTRQQIEEYMSELDGLGLSSREFAKRMADKFGQENIYNVLREHPTLAMELARVMVGGAEFNTITNFQQDIGKIDEQFRLLMAKVVDAPSLDNDAKLSASMAITCTLIDGFVARFPEDLRFGILSQISAKLTMGKTIN